MARIFVGFSPIVLIACLVSAVAQADVVLYGQIGRVTGFADAEAGPYDAINVTIPGTLYGYNVPTTKLYSQSVPDPSGGYGTATVTTTLTAQAITSIPGNGSVNFQGNASATTLVQTQKSPYGAAYQGAGQASTQYSQAFSLTSPEYYQYEAFASAGAMVANFTGDSIVGSGSGTTIATSGILQPGTYNIVGSLGIFLVLQNGTSGYQSESYTYNLTLSPNPIPTPLPASVWMFGSGLACALGFSRKRRARSSFT